MKLKISAILLLCFASPAFAQVSLSDQINSVDSVQQQQQAAARAQYYAQQEAMRHAEAQRAQMESRRQAAAIQAARAKAADAAADKRRDQSYEDKLREMNVEEQEMRLQAEKAHVARENEFIDRELKKNDAQTDVIQSTADANRNLTSGAKELMQKEGDADIKKESHIFGH